MSTDAIDPLQLMRAIQSCDGLELDVAAKVVGVIRVRRPWYLPDESDRALRRRAGAVFVERYTMTKLRVGKCACEGRA